MEKMARNGEEEQAGGVGDVEGDPFYFIFLKKIYN